MVRQAPFVSCALGVVLVASAMVACESRSEAPTGPAAAAEAEPSPTPAASDSPAASTSPTASGAPGSSAADDAETDTGVLDEATISGVLEPFADVPDGVEPLFGQKIDRWGGRRAWTDASDAVELRTDALDQVHEVRVTLGGQTEAELVERWGRPLNGAGAGELVWLAPAMHARVVFVPASGESTAMLVVQPCQSAEKLINTVRLETDGALLGQSLDKLEVAFDVVRTPTDPPVHAIRLSPLPRSPHDQLPEAVLSLDPPGGRSGQVVGYHVRVPTRGDTTLAAELDAALARRFGALPAPDDSGWRALTTEPATVYERSTGSTWLLSVERSRELAEALTRRIGGFGPAAGLAPGQSIDDAAYAAPLLFDADHTPRTHTTAMFGGLSFSVVARDGEVAAIHVDGPRETLSAALRKAWKAPRTVGEGDAAAEWWHDAKLQRRARLTGAGDTVTLEITSFVPIDEMLGRGPTLGPGRGADTLLAATRDAVASSPWLAGALEGDTARLHVPPTELAERPTSVTVTFGADDRVSRVEVELAPDPTGLTRDLALAALERRYGRASKIEGDAVAWTFKKRGAELREGTDGTLAVALGEL